MTQSFPKYRNCILTIFASCLLFLTAACGGGSGGSGSTEAPPSSVVADAEAGRIAVLYRYTQGLGTLMLSHLTEVGVGSRRSGTRPCSAGGSVTYADTTPNPSGDPQSLISFNDCQETIGQIRGTLQVKHLLVRLNPDGSGSFNVSWTAAVSIDGYEMAFESASGFVTRTSSGAVQIETFGGRDNALRLTSPDGRSVQFSDARIRIDHDPSSGRANFGGTDVQMRSPSTADLNAVLLVDSLTTSAVTASSGLISLGTPQSGSFTYRRSFDATATDLTGTGTTSGGLLGLTIESLPQKYGFPGSAGQYAWSALLLDPEFSLPAGAP